MKRFVLLAFVLFLQLFLQAQLDTLRAKYNRATNDTVRIDLLFKHGNSKNYSQKTCDSILQLLHTFHRSNNCFTKNYSMVKTGEAAMNNQDAENALSWLMKSLAVADSCKNSFGIMMSRNRLAMLNKLTQNYEACIYNAHSAIHYAKILKDSIILSHSYTLIGNIYKSRKLLDSALIYHHEALKIREKFRNKNPLGITYNNLGLVYKNLGQYDKALDYMRKSYQIAIVLNNSDVYKFYNNASIVFALLNKYDSALYYAKKELNYGIENKNGEAMVYAFELLATNYYDKKDYKLAAINFKRYFEVNDSVKSLEISDRFQQMQSKYESDKKDAELRDKENSLKLSEAENSKKNLLMVFSSIALILAMVAAGVIYYSYRQSKKNANQLSLKNSVIEEKNREITDSINYAKNIQHSLISSDKVFQENLNEHFILHLPKDIVSGDFYWAQATNDGFVIICSDCTGHGVPGAFMSLLGISFLKEIVNQRQITQPNLIFNELREYITECFDKSPNKDGMDASLLRIKNNKMDVAAANNPVWVIRDHELIVIKADKFPIGKHMDIKRSFSLSSFSLKSGDLVLQFTDGYADQFGGDKNKKLKYKTLQSLILNNSKKPLAELKEQLLSTLQEWKGHNEQVDDILIMGFRV